MTKLLSYLFPSLIIILISFFIQIGVDPHYEGLSTDSGVFAYCGNKVLAGELLYRDCLDNKPPAIYYLNAAAIWIGGPTPWAIWIFHASWITLAFLAFYWTQSQIWTNRGAFLAAIILIFTVLYPSYYIGGNYTETFALLPIILAIILFFNYLTTQNSRFLIGLGLATAFTFLLKPTYVSIGAACGLLALILDGKRKDYRSLSKNLGILLVSILLPILFVVAYWQVKNSLYEFIFAVFLHNKGYIEDNFSFHSLASTVKFYLVYQPLASLTIMAGIAFSGFIFENRYKIFSTNASHELIKSVTPGKMGQENARLWLVAAVGLSVVVDFGLTAISSKNFGHYFIVTIPALVTLINYLFYRISKLNKQEVKKFSLVTAISAVYILTFSWALEILSSEIPSSYYLKRFFTQNITTHQPNEIEKYILEHSSSDQSVLVWGLRPDLNFTTGRRSPTRFIFLLHLFSPTSKGPNGFHEFLDGIKADPPAVITVDTNSGLLPFFGAEGDLRCPDCDVDEKTGMEKLNQFVEQNYSYDGQIYDWLVYLYK